VIVISDLESMSVGRPETDELYSHALHYFNQAKIVQFTELQQPLWYKLLLNACLMAIDIYRKYSLSFNMY